MSSDRDGNDRTVTGATLDGSNGTDIGTRTSVGGGDIQDHSSSVMNMNMADIINNNMMSDDVGSEQVRALAAALAPQVRELESLMDDPLLRSSHDHYQISFGSGNSDGNTGGGDTSGTHGSGTEASIGNVVDTTAIHIRREQDLKPPLKTEGSFPKVISDDDDTFAIPDDETEAESETRPSNASQSMKKSNNNNNNGDEDMSSEAMMTGMDDDDMDHELEQLAYAEDILRRELDLAKDFATFFGSSPFNLGGPTPSDTPMSRTPDPTAASFAGGFRNMNLDFNVPTVGSTGTTTNTSTAATSIIAPTNLFQTNITTVTGTATTAASNSPTANPTRAATSNKSAISSQTIDKQTQATAMADLPIQQMEADLDGDEGDPELEQEEQQEHNEQLKENNTRAKFNPKLMPQETLHFDAETVTVADQALLNHQSTGSITFDSVGTALQSATDAVAASHHPNMNADELHVHVPTTSDTNKNTSAATTTTATTPNNAQQPKQTDPSHAAVSTTNSIIHPTPSNRNERNNNNQSSNISSYKYKTPSNRRQQQQHKHPEQQEPPTPQTSVVLCKAPQFNYTSTDHFRSLKLEKEPQGAWYSVDLTHHLVPVPVSIPVLANTHNNNNATNATTQGVPTTDDGLNINLNSNDSAIPSTPQQQQQKGLPTTTAGMGIKEYCLSITQWKRLFVGLRLEGDEERQLKRQQQRQQQQPPASPQSRQSTHSGQPQQLQAPLSQQQQQQAGQLQQEIGNQQSPASKAPSLPSDPSSPFSDEAIQRKAPVRTISIRIRPDVLCGAVMDAVTQTLVNCPHSSIIKRQGGHLQATVKGQVVPQTMLTTPQHIPYGSPPNSTMDSSLSAPPSTTPTPTSDCGRQRRSPAASANTVVREYTFFVDVQLCTHKSAACERVLLLRVFHWGKEEQDATEEGDLWSPSNAATNPAAVADSNNPFAPPSTTEDYLMALDGGVDYPHSPTTTSTMQQHQQSYQANKHLREACALIQRIESPELARKMRPLVHKSTPTASVAAELREMVSEHLLQNYRACPSVLQPGTTITLPALSPQDWPVIQASWSWIQSVWEELETRELTYLSFLPISWMSPTTTPPLAAGTDAVDGIHSDTTEDSTMPLSLTAPPAPRFGAFPALPTLDVQYCSQLRRLSREAMIGQLLKAASVLEDYARQAEYQCANLIDLLRPTFAYYGVNTPSLPKPAPLSAYPLDYTPPQSLCPPWGMKVMEAMNQVTAMSHAACQHQNNMVTGEPQDPAAIVAQQQQQSFESIALAETAVQMVYEAFQQQDDEEHSARLARKNLQVMDRLAKMQEHNRASINALSTSIPTSDAAKAAADDFFAKAGNAIIGMLQAKNGSRGAGAEQDGVRTSVHAPPFREVPLMKWTMGVGGSSGTCTITANQILFTPAKLIPLLSHSQSTWFHLADVEFGIVSNSPTLLNPLSTVIQVLDINNGNPVYSFKPSSAGPRLKSFLDIVQKESAEATAAKTRRSTK